jgi:hypothetical protein
MLSSGGGGNGPTENQERGGMARTAGHAVNGVEDRRRSDFCMFGAQSANEVIGREGRGVGLRRRSDQGFRERQTAPTRRWL